MLRCTIQHAPTNHSGEKTMFEQMSQQMLSMSKQFAATIVQANTVAVDHFEKLVDLQLKTIESGSTVMADLVEQVSAVKSAEDFRAMMPKSISMMKAQAEKSVALSQEVGALVGKTAEQFTGLVKGQFETANDAVLKTAKVVNKR
jgi:Phasin protein